ncbi:MAG: FGGY-family carbohydrate kinase [Candidatus Omnitrophica bacterium]|nr:FGGY-family carbohydrate kinase [Candidatus Omnitrophota bacterium]
MKLTNKIKLPFKVKKPVLSFGSQAKNTLCFAKGNFALISRIHDDLNNLDDFLLFEKDAKYFLNKKPKVLAFDLHPDYQSTSYASSLNNAFNGGIAIQHHHAHIAACMAENGLKNEQVIGVAFDGSGLGFDNTIWGAEFLICNYKTSVRIAHLKKIKLLGGEKAILEPWRIAAAWLNSIYGGSFLKLKIDFTKGVDKIKWHILKEMESVSFNTPLTSSMGRLFDAFASLVLVKYNASYEAQLPIELEKLATRANVTSQKTYQFGIKENAGMFIIDPSPLFRAAVADLKNKRPKAEIAYCFHLAVANAINDICLRIRKTRKINTIVLSGGVFQNKLLLGLSKDCLKSLGFTVLTHKKLSCNDSSVSLGQAVVANFNTRTYRKVRV